LIWEGARCSSFRCEWYIPSPHVEFDLIRDNWQSPRCTALVLTMPLHLPTISSHGKHDPCAESLGLGRRAWSILGLQLSGRSFYRVGTLWLHGAVSPIALTFNITSPKQRRSSREFLRRAYQENGSNTVPAWLARSAFVWVARKRVDTFCAWLPAVDSDTNVRVDNASSPIRGYAETREFHVLIVSSGATSRSDRGVARTTPSERESQIFVHTVHAENFRAIPFGEFRLRDGQTTPGAEDIRGTIVRYSKESMSARLG